MTQWIKKPINMATLSILLIGFSATITPRQTALQTIHIFLVISGAALGLSISTWHCIHFSKKWYRYYKHKQRFEHHYTELIQRLLKASNMVDVFKSKLDTIKKDVVNNVVNNIEASKKLVLEEDKQRVLKRNKTLDKSYQETTEKKIHLEHISQNWKNHLMQIRRFISLCYLHLTHHISSIELFSLVGFLSVMAFYSIKSQMLSEFMPLLVIVIIPILLRLHIISQTAYKKSFIVLNHVKKMRALENKRHSLELETPCNKTYKCLLDETEQLAASLLQEHDALFADETQALEQIITNLHMNETKCATGSEISADEM